MAILATNPLTESERVAKNSADTSKTERFRLYGKDLIHTADCYAVAADATGLRKDAAKYLYGESLRLRREGMIALDHADDLDFEALRASN